VLHKPFERAGAIIVRELLDVTLAVDQHIEHIIVISPAEARVGEFQKKVDDAARIRSAIDVIPDENPTGGGIAPGDGVDQSAERLSHAVNVADDPSHIA